MLEMGLGKKGEIAFFLHIKIKSHFTVAFVQCGGPDEEG